MKITKLTSLAVKTPATIAGTSRTFAVMHDVAGEPDGLFYRRFTSEVGSDSRSNFEPRRLGNGQYAHHALTSNIDEATEFRTRDEAGLFHSELQRPGKAVIVCVDR